jgi:hypothetical protein
MQTSTEALLAGGASAATTFAYYPFRDWTKHFSPQSPALPAADFFTARWKGMALNYTQPFVLCAPTAALYGSYLGTQRATNSQPVGAVVGGTCHAAAKVAVGIFALRMDTGERHGKRGVRAYASPLACIQQSTKRLGALSWLQGIAPVAAAHVLWYGGTMAVLQSRHRYRRAAPSFASDWWEAFRLHAFAAFLTSPLRNAFRAATAVKDAAPVRDFASLLRGERAVLAEGSGAAVRMLKERGPGYFLQGNVRVAFGTSLPWALSFALYRQLGGTLDPA